MIAAVYARKSNEQRASEDAKSVARQVQLAKEFCKRKGWTVDERCVFKDDAVSGAKESRPGLDRLVAALSPKPRFNVLVVMEQSRLARFDEPIDALILMRRIEKAGVEIWSYRDKRLRPDIEGFVRSMGDSQERKAAVERGQEAYKHRFELGKHMGGTPPFGYSRDWKIIHREAEVVRRIFKLRVQGEGYHTIARMLEADHIKPPGSDGMAYVRELDPKTGKNVPARDSEGKVIWQKVSGSWSTSAIGSILHNEAYVGTFKAKALRREKHHAPIIERKVFDQVQRINKEATDRTWRTKDGRVLRSRPTNSPWVLAPFLQCGTCGGGMHGYKSDSGKPYYKCTRRKLTPDRCTNTGALPHADAVKAVQGMFASVLVHAVVTQELERYIEGQRKLPKVDRRQIQHEAEKLRQECKRLVDALARGDSSDIRTGLKERQAKLEHLDGLLVGSDADERKLHVDEFKRQLQPVVAEWQKHLTKNESTMAQVLRKILVGRIKATPPGRRTRNGSGWKLDADAGMREIMKEVGVDAINRVLMRLPGYTTAVRAKAGLVFEEWARVKRSSQTSRAARKDPFLTRTLHAIL